MSTEDGLNAIIDSLRYSLAQERTEAATARCNAESYYRELCRIRERAAECVSQHQPLAEIVGEMAGECPRKMINHSIRYVVYGRKDKV